MEDKTKTPSDLKSARRYSRLSSSSVTADQYRMNLPPPLTVQVGATAVKD
jgi:hypothetical protein